MTSGAFRRDAWLHFVTRDGSWLIYRLCWEENVKEMNARRTYVHPACMCARVWLLCPNVVRASAAAGVLSVVYCTISVFLIADTRWSGNTVTVTHHMCDERAHTRTETIHTRTPRYERRHSLSPSPSPSSSAGWNTRDADIRCESRRCLMSQALGGPRSEVLNMLPSGVVTHRMMKSVAHAGTRRNKKLFYLHCGEETNSPT